MPSPTHSSAERSNSKVTWAGYVTSLPSGTYMKPSPASNTGADLPLMVECQFGNELSLKRTPVPGDEIAILRNWGFTKVTAKAGSLVWRGDAQLISCASKRDSSSE